MNEENRLIIKQLNKFGRIPETSELLKMIEDLEKERTMYKTSSEVMSKNYFELQNNWNELKKWLEEEHKRNISWYGSLTHHDKQYYLYKFGTTKDVLDNVQDKMQELEGNDE